MLPHGLLRMGLGAGRQGCLRKPPQFPVLNPLDVEALFPISGWCTTPIQVLLHPASCVLGSDALSPPHGSPAHPSVHFVSRSFPRDLLIGTLHSALI